MVLLIESERRPSTPFVHLIVYELFFDKFPLRQDKPVILYKLDQVFDEL